MEKSNLEEKLIGAKDVFRVLGEHLLVDGFHLVVDLEKSKGSRIYDAATGKWYLDFYTFFASSPIGLNHPRICEPAFQERLLVAARNKPSNSDAYTVEMARFVDAVSRYAMPEGLPHLYLVEGGSVGVENALKTAFDWKVRKNIRDGRGSELGMKVMHFRRAFHGRTGYTLSLTNTDPVKTDYYPKFDWPRISNPTMRFPQDEQERARVEQAEAKALAEMEEAFSAMPHDIAAVIIEPIQGEGGDGHFRGEFFRAIRDLCDRHDALFVVDEVQTGVGLTGKMWAYQHFDFEPDILCFGKKMQVCGIMVSRRIDEIPDNVFKVSSRINSTWGGNLTDMVRAVRYLEVIEEEKLVENAGVMGGILKDGIEKLQRAMPEKLENARGRGLMCAFDLATPELRKSAIARCHENGLMMLPCGPQGIRFRPSLNVTQEEIEEGLERLKKSIEEAE